MVEYLRKRAQEHGLSNIRAEVMDGQALDVDDASFDAAFSVFGLIFFPDRAAGFRQVHRALKPGGRAAIVSWSSIDRCPLVEVMMRALRQAIRDFRQPEEPPLLLSLADRSKLREEMLAAGFRYVNIFSVSHVCVLPSPEWMSERMCALSPAITFLFEGLSAEERTAVGEAYSEIMRSTQGQGPYGLEAEAHIAVGVR
jgi:SAM-dependent methyltransferase